MPITHFKILEIPDPNIVITEKQGGVLLLDTLYPVSEQNEISFRRTDSFKELYVNARIKYIMYDSINDFYGNPSFGNIIWKNDNSNPGSENIGITILNTDRPSLIDILQFTSGVEFVIFTEIEKARIYYHGTNPIVLGQKYMVSSLSNIIIKPYDTGGGTPYSRLRYQTGKYGIPPNIDIINPQVYDLITTIVSSASLIEGPSSGLSEYLETFDVGGTDIEYNVKEQVFDVQIHDGTFQGTAKLNIIVNSPFLSLNQWNNVSFTSGDNVVTMSDNGTFEMDVETDNLGRASILVRNEIIEDTSAAKIGEIQMELISIDGDPNKVSSTKTLTLNTNY